MVGLLLLDLVFVEGYDEHSMALRAAAPTLRAILGAYAIGGEVGGVAGDAEVIVAGVAGGTVEEWGGGDGTRVAFGAAVGEGDCWGDCDEGGWCCLLLLVGRWAVFTIRDYVDGMSTW